MTRFDVRIGLCAVALAVMLGACGQPQGAAPDNREEGVIGASSGPNPNLSDIQAETQAEQDAQVGPEATVELPADKAPSEPHAPDASPPPG